MTKWLHDMRKRHPLHSIHNSTETLAYLETATWNWCQIIQNNRDHLGLSRSNVKHWISHEIAQNRYSGASFK